MNKVVTIHLDGIAYNLEEVAYDALRAYLDAAKATLAQNPDKDEILKDLEQAIGAKLSGYLSAHKNVVTKSDVDAVLVEMGPVAAEGEGGSTEDGSEKASSASAPHKRLYRIPEGAWLAGVSTGLAAYFNIDVSVVRVLFVILIAFSHGFGGLAYILLWIVVPTARTPKDYENASGVPPVTAQELVDRARKGIEHFANSGEWQQWRTQLKSNRHAWKAQHKAWKRAQKQEWKRHHAAHHQSFLSELNGFIWSMFGLLIMLFGIWYLYHHVELVQQFIDFVRSTWNSFFYTLSNELNNM